MSETEEARMRRYSAAIWPLNADHVATCSACRRELQAVIAIADEEQAALRADRNVAYGSAQHRAEAAEAEVERLTRECLDREATETDARERLRQAEERLDKVKAMHRLASDGQHCFTCVMPWH